MDCGGIAVLGVVLFHSGLTGFSGGGRGVDVFFVLSGYLITSLLLSENDKTGSIGILRFWLRRALRLTRPLGAMLGAYVALCPLLLPNA